MTPENMRRQFVTVSLSKPTNEPTMLRTRPCGEMGCSLHDEERGKLLELNASGSHRDESGKGLGPYRRLNVGLPAR
jgi:hypothetical protein